MKAKLTLNIDDKIVAQAKIESEKRNVSPSSVVENYLDHFSKSGSKKQRTMVHHFWKESGNIQGMRRQFPKISIIKRLYMDI